jgi:hypothetical protein
MKARLNKEVHVRLSEQDMERLKRLAEINHRSVGNQVQLAVLKFLDQAEARHRRPDGEPTPLFADGKNAGGDEPASSPGQGAV